MKDNHIPKEKHNKKKSESIQQLEKKILKLQKENLELKKKAEILNSFMDNFPGTIFIKDSEGRVQFLNKYMEKIFGLSNWKNKTAQDLFPAEVAEKMKKDDLEVLTKGTKTIEETVPDKKGKENIYQMHKFTIDTKDNAPLIGGIAIDITKLKHAEASLIKSEENYRSLIEAVKDGIGIINVKGELTYVNEGLCRMFGYKKSEMLGANVFHIINKEDREVLLNRLKKRRIGDDSSYETILPRKDGRRINLIVSPKPMFNEKGQYIGSLSVFTEITEFKFAEKLLKVQRDLGINLGLAKDFDDVLKLCLEAALDASEMDCGGIYLMNAKTGEMDLFSHIGLSSKFINAAKHFSADSPNIKLVKKGRPVYTSYENLQLPNDKARSSEHLKAIGIIPILYKKKVIACLNIASHNLYEIPIKSRESLEMIASQIAIAIINKQAELALKESEERFRSLGDSSPIGLFYTDSEGKVLYTNKSWQEITGLNLRQSLGSNWSNALHPDDKDDLLSEWGKCIIEVRGYTGEFRFVRPSGEERWVFTKTSPVTNEKGEVLGHVGANEDITERKLAQDRIKASLYEKEILLKEIHHRVKNNMQIISSLLSLQSEYVFDKRDASLFEESKSRIRSMAMVHEKLYQSKDLSKIDFKQFIDELVNDLSLSYRNSIGNIGISTKVKNIYLGIDYGVPCALIINELISNSLKYAFPDNRNGEISIDFKKTGKKYILSVSDNGIGFPSDIDFKDSETFGLKIVNALINQISGEIELDNKNGTRFIIEFSIED